MRAFKKESDLSKVAEYIKENYDGYIEEEVNWTKVSMERWRTPLRITNSSLSSTLEDLAECYCIDHHVAIESMWEQIETDDILFEL